MSWQASCLGATTCFDVGDNGTILSTIDGRTWSSRSVGSATLDGITRYTTTQCWVVGSGGTFLHTSDGQTWQSENAGGTNKTMYAITCPFGGTCYAVGALGAIWVSNTAGASWSNQSLSTLQWFTGLPATGRPELLRDRHDRPYPRP